jgi:hypothetical protein
MRSMHKEIGHVRRKRVHADATQGHEFGDRGELGRSLLLLLMKG